VWPLVLALLVGSVIGFALAVSMMGRSVSDTQAETPPAQVPGAAAPTGLRAREFTEDAVNEPRKSGSTDAAAPVVPSGPSPAIEAAPMSPERAERGPRSVPQPAALANLGRILVRSTPAGARVLVDGRDAGVTPLTMRELPQGSHTVRVMRDGFVTADRRVAITAARPAQSLTIELQRAATTSPEASSPSTLGRFTGPLTVDSRPAGASVFVDGKPVGTTPLQLLSLDAGEHAIRLELAGYRRWTSSVRVVAGDQNRVTASLER
jgi:hypothetical protein